MMPRVTFYKAKLNIFISSDIYFLSFFWLTKGYQEIHVKSKWPNNVLSVPNLKLVF